MSNRGVNEVRLLGNVGNDPDIHYSQAGNAIARVSLATTSVRKDRDGNNQERTEWHRLVFFGKLAEIVSEYVRQGTQLWVGGELRYDKYTGTDGVERYSTDIVCDEMRLLGGGRDGREGGQQRGQNQNQGQRQTSQGARSDQRGNGTGTGGPQRGGTSGPRGGAPQQQRQRAQHAVHQAYDDAQGGMDEDIPFAKNDGLF